MATQSREAPGELAIVRGFVNTLDIDLGTDALSAPSALAPGSPSTGCSTTLLRRRRRPGPSRRPSRGAAGVPAEQQRRAPAGRRCAGRARRGRGARRATPAGGPGGGARLEAERGGVDGALGRLLLIVYRAMEAGPGRASRLAATTPAAGPSTTTPRTARATGARCRCAATSARRGSTGSATGRASACRPRPRGSTCRAGGRASRPPGLPPPRRSAAAEVADGDEAAGIAGLGVRHRPGRQADEERERLGRP